MRSPSLWQELRAATREIDADAVVGAAALAVILIAGLWIGAGLGLSPDSEAMIFPYQ